MKGNPMKRNFGLPGIDNNSEGNTDKPDGKSASSAFQQMDETTPGPPQMKVPTGAKDVSAPLMHKKKDPKTGEKVKHKHKSKLKRILIGKKGRALADKLSGKNSKKKDSPAKHRIKTSDGRLVGHNEWMEVDGKQHRHASNVKGPRDNPKEQYREPSLLDIEERENKYKLQSKKQAKESAKRRNKSKSQEHKKGKNIKDKYYDATAGVLQDPRGGEPTKGEIEIRKERSKIAGKKVKKKK